MFGVGVEDNKKARVLNGLIGQGVLRATFLVDLLDVALNLSVAILTGSVVMLSEFFQGLADLTAAAFLLVGYTNAQGKRRMNVIPSVTEKRSIFGRSSRRS